MSSAPELTQLSANQALAVMEKWEISSLQLTQACLNQIERLEPRLHAFITIISESALKSARTADDKRSRFRRHPDEDLPPLLGLPVAVKDLLALADVPCTCGSRILENYIPPYTATSVQRILDAGAVVLGKTNMDEFAMGSSTENSAFGPTRNPWDLTRVPGGSSGGSAAAVSTGMAPIALGSDTGGSIRQPTSFCGITGIKPSYGRVSRYGLVAYGSSLDSVGAFARSAADTALLFQIIAGHDPLDATSIDLSVPEIKLNGSTGLKGLQVGVPKEYFISGMQAEVESGVKAAVSQLENLGAQVREISLPHSEYAIPVYYLIAPAEASANLARYDGVRYGLRADADSLWDLFVRTRGAGFGSEVKRRIMLGTYALSAGYYDAYYAKAQKARTLIKRDFDQAFKDVDVIATPVAPTTAFPIGEHSGDPLAMYLEDVFTLPANLAGIPGLAFPVGFDRQGLPVGMQLLAAPFCEETLFQAVHAYQLATDWHARRPAIAQ